MPSDLLGLPIFYEAYSPDQPGRFDVDLDEYSKLTAREQRTLKGFCNITGAATSFTVHSENLREDIVADVSSSINRHRQIICALSLSIFGSPHSSLFDIAAYINQKRLRIYSAEANSPIFHFLRDHLDPELFVYSEYFGPEYRSGETVNGIRHEDLQRTSFSDQTFDIVITCDVFEHIPDAVTAEREVIRILKDKGIYCFTVPYIPEAEHDLVLAEATPDGQITYFAEPQYHGDPIRPEEGILVYRLFSFRDLKQRFESLGCTFISYRIWSKALGIIDGNGWVQVVTRETPSTSIGSNLIGGRLLRELNERLAETHERVLQSEAQVRELTSVARETHTRLAEQQAALAWMQTSRSWRLAGFLRTLWRFLARLRTSADRIQYQMGLGGAMFFGKIDAPSSNSNSGDLLEISGWVFSTAAPVVAVEVFLGGNYLGLAKYGKERNDVPTSSAKDTRKTGYAGHFLWPLTARRDRRLWLRAFDARGHSHLFSRLLPEANESHS